MKVSKEDKDLLDFAFKGTVNQWLKVSKVTFTDDSLTKYNVCEVKIEKAKGSVCARCWNVVEIVDSNCLCERCQKVLG